MSRKAVPQSYALIVLGGVIENRSLLQELVANATHVIAADGAAEVARAQSVTLHSIVGDLDSVSDDTIEFFRALNTEIHANPDQYSNDFEKALRHAIALGARHVRVIGIGGGRTDHVLTNISVMRRFTDDFESLRAYDDQSEMQMLSPSRSMHTFTSPVGTVVSLVPIGFAHGVTTRGMMYPIDNRSMVFGTDEGLSNVIVEAGASVAIRGGALLIAVALAAPNPS